VLAKYLEYNEVGKLGRVIEIGSGVGLSGIAAAACNAEYVLLTDLPYTLKTIQDNVDATLKAWGDDDDDDDDDDKKDTEKTTCNRTLIEVDVLDWSDLPSKSQSFDTVLSADCVWIPDLVPAFIQTLVHLRSSSSSSSHFRVLLSHQTRSLETDRLLFSGLESNHFKIQQINTHKTLPKEYFVSKIRIYELT